MRVKNVSEWLEASSNRFPDKIVFSDGKTEMTFVELREAARHIGSELARRGCFKSPVMIKMGKEPRAMAAFLGCAYSGNFYTPMDLDAPAEREEKIKSMLHPAEIISAENIEEFLHAEIDEELLEEARRKQIDADLLYVLFTSGSTGMPKGVAVQHRGVIDYIENIVETFGFDENTVHGQAVPIFFDSSILPIYTTLRCGGSDYLIPKKTLMFAAKTVDFLNEHKCNAIYWVPTSYNIIAKSRILDKRIPKYVDKCLFVGEVMTGKVLNVWRQALPNAMYANLMGPTECTDTYLYYIVDREIKEDEAVPVGSTYNNVDVLILNEDDQPCKVGEKGELCVRGSKVSCGYYNDWEKTKTAYVQNPLNKAYPEMIYRTGDLVHWNEQGELIYDCRKDFQIKHSGHRIELGEIESVAGSVDGIDMCACIYDKENEQILMFYCGSLDESAVKKELKGLLPPYMVPGKIEKRKTMPRTGSGKIDRTALRLDEDLK